MIGTILKLSYNKIGGNDLTGGICGTAFFVESNMIATANHVMRKEKFIPNEGFSRCQFWLLMKPDIIIEINEDYLIESPEIDLTLIKLPNKYPVKSGEFSDKLPSVGEECHNNGFRANNMPILSYDWVSERLAISDFDLQSVSVEGSGKIKSLLAMNIDSNDIKMKNVQGIEVSYAGVLGMSGSPLQNSQNKIIGLMSIGLPANVAQKENLFAVSVREIQPIIQKII
jgi:hypothetical protein